MLLLIVHYIFEHILGTNRRLILAGSLDPIDSLFNFIHLIVEWLCAIVWSLSELFILGTLAIFVMCVLLSHSACAISLFLADPAKPTTTTASVVIAAKHHQLTHPHHIESVVMGDVFNEE